MVFKQQMGAHLYQPETNYSSILLVGWSSAKIAEGLHRLNECLLKIKQIPTGANLIPIKENTKRGSSCFKELEDSYHIRVSINFNQNQITLIVLVNLIIYTYFAKKSTWSFGIIGLIVRLKLNIASNAHTV